MSGALLSVYAFAVGACIGSFLNVCIGRWPAGESVVRPRSRCPKCAQGIAWYDNIPIVSWLLLRGRCRGCRAPISVQYPLVELVVALGWLAAVWTFGPTFTGLRVAAFGTTMLGIAITDAKHYLIPDGFTVFGLAWVLVTAMVGAVFGHVTPFALPFDALVGACAGAGSIAIVGWLGEVVLKREAMGFGDVTLMAVVGAALGPERSFLTIFLGALVGALSFLLIVYPLVRRRRRAAAGDAAPEIELPQVPFGVFLAPAALAALLWGQQLIDWYLSRAFLIT